MPHMEAIYGHVANVDPGPNFFCHVRLVGGFQNFHVWLVDSPESNSNIREGGGSHIINNLV